MNPNKWKTISLVMQIIGGLLALCCNKFKILLYIGLSIFVFGLLLDMAKGRCPYCRKPFWGKGKFIVQCPHCNRKFYY